MLQVVERSKKTRAETRDVRIRNYFYGIKNNLFPHTFEVKFSEVTLFKIGGMTSPAVHRMLPIAYAISCMAYTLKETVF